MVIHVRFIKALYNKELMKAKTLQQVKDQIAQLEGYSDWDSIFILK